MSDAPNKTDSRVTALKEVTAGLIAYSPRTGEYIVTGESEAGEVIRGARRRTFSELRSDGVIELTSLSEAGPVKLTQSGISVARDWGVIAEDGEVD